MPLRLANLELVLVDFFPVEVANGEVEDDDVCVDVDKLVLKLEKSKPVDIQIKYPTHNSMAMILSATTHHGRITGVRGLTATIV